MPLALLQNADSSDEETCQNDPGAVVRYVVFEIEKCWNWDQVGVQRNQQAQRG